MYIPDDQWDDLTIFCSDLLEKLEALPPDIFFACKDEAIVMCYEILNLQDRPIPLLPVD